MRERVILSWSGGKDSTLALHQLRQAGEHEVAGLLTTVTRDYDRISMHGVRRSLLEQQAESLGLPLHVVEISSRSSNEEYQNEMHRALAAFVALGIQKVVFGDIFLADVRRYREELVDGAGLQALFPLWGANTTELAHRFLALGYQATVTCVDTLAIGREFAGRRYDAAFLRDLPATADPCGENGEFLTFVHDGPILRDPIAVERGELVLRDERFCFCDLLGGGE